MNLKGIMHCISKHVHLSEPTTKIWMKIRLYYQRQRCSPMTLDSGNIRFMWTFMVILKIYVNLPQRFYACIPILCIQEIARLSRFQFQVFVYDSYTAATVLKCVTSGDVGSGVSEYDPQSIWNPWKNCGSFVDATSSESYCIVCTVDQWSDTNK